MAWQKRGKRAYYYHSVRQGGRVRRVYHGTGPTGQLAAAVDALRRAERQAEEAARRTAKGQLDVAVALMRDLSRGCEVLAAGTLLAAGFHRPSRHCWRPWRYGRRALKASD